MLFGRIYGVLMYQTKSECLCGVPAALFFPPKQIYSSEALSPPVRAQIVMMRLRRYCILYGSVPMQRSAG